LQINLNPASAGAGTAISVLDEYFQELHRIKRIPWSIPLDQGVFELTFMLDAPRFEMVKPTNAEPYTRLLLTGTFERRFGVDPPEIHPLDCKVLLKLVPLPQATVGLEFDGLEETPSSPLTEIDVRNLFAGPLQSVVGGFRYPSAKAIIDGLKGLESLDPQLVGQIPDVDDWEFAVTLMPAGTDTVDSFAASVGFLKARPTIQESFVPEGQEFAVAFSVGFLDLMLELGANANEGKVFEGAKILAPLKMSMNPDSIEIKGRAWTEVPIFPDVTVSFEGPMHPFLVRGTTIMGFNMDDVEVDAGDDEEIFYSVMKWFTALFAGAALVSGVGWLFVAGLVSFGLTQLFWNIDVKIENAPNILRNNLAGALGAALEALSASLDDQTPVGQLRIDATPDSLRIVDRHMIFLAQILVRPATMQLVAGEYSKELRRFVIFELQDGRRFRAQELARLMAAGKITVPGFHHVMGKYIRANPDDAVANNLLKSFKSNLASEVVLPNT
jgi:hypothetical protein